MDSPDDALDALLSGGELAAAIALVVSRGSGGRTQADRPGGAVYAMAGAERGVAGAVDPRLLGCRSHADVTAWMDAQQKSSSDDLLAASVVLSWSAPATEVSACLRHACARATEERRFHVAVAALERLAHYALLFGDTMQGRRAIEDALELATTHNLAAWRLRCSARAAQFALDTDDLDRAVQLLEDASAAQSPELVALFAPAGVQVALRVGNEIALRSWTSPSLIDVALYSDAPFAPVAATCAFLLASPLSRPLEQQTSAALRRAIARVEGASSAVELLALAARYGDEDDARLAMDSLRAVFAPQRRYIEAHYRLARAHLLARTGDRAGAVDTAGDAARAFDSMGLRRWTNEAMLLLVRHDDIGGPPPRRRPTAVSLTQREQQVAHLIGRGASNREVARALQISEHTVERHVSSILSRLGLRSRWQIVDAHNTTAER
jgi:DNA-binding CsgD family transcriptional regulator